MTQFRIHDETSAPSQSKELLVASKKQNGFVPALHGVMAEAPSLLQAYITIGKLFTESSFDKDELTVVWQSINVENACHYCVPAHSAIAKGMGVDDAITAALRDGTPLPSDRLEALRTFTLHVVRGHGNVAEADVQAFLDAGFDQQQILEVILGLAQKVMSNYTNHFAKTPLDERFKPFEWSQGS